MQKPGVEDYLLTQIRLLRDENVNSANAKLILMCIQGGTRMLKIINQTIAIVN